jgi:hypothetical protein
MQEQDSRHDLRIEFGDAIPAHEASPEEPLLHYHYPIELVRQGWQMWRENNFGYPMPDPNILLAIDPRWRDDLYNYHAGVEYQKAATRQELARKQMPKLG